MQTPPPSPEITRRPLAESSSFSQLILFSDNDHFRSSHKDFFPKLTRFERIEKSTAGTKTMKTLGIKQSDINEYLTNSSITMPIDVAKYPKIAKLSIANKSGSRLTNLSVKDFSSHDYVLSNSLISEIKSLDRRTASSQCLELVCLRERYNE